MSYLVEIESGTSDGWVHRHNGYYAGDFSDQPVHPARFGQLPGSTTPTWRP